MQPNFEASFFALLDMLDAVSRREIESCLSPLEFPANAIIYQQGTVASSVYIIVSGRVEAFTVHEGHNQTRSLGYLSRGDFFGDLGVLTGQNRLASVRTCDRTHLYLMEKSAFLRLLDKIPKFATYFVRNLARRLHDSSTEAYIKVFESDFTGNLAYFDLLTIFQAITSSGRSGELNLNNAGGEVIGSFFFTKGRAVHARYLHLAGAEAVWQGFLALANEGSFVFRVIEEPITTFSEQTALHMESIELLLQGASRRDNYASLPEARRRLEGRLSRLTESLAWVDPESQAVAERIWELVSKRPQPLDSLWRRLNVSTHTFLEILGAMVSSGQAEIVTEPPSGD